LVTHITTTDGKEISVVPEITVEPVEAGVLNQTTGLFTPGSSYIGPVEFTVSVPGFAETKTCIVNIWGIVRDTTANTFSSIDALSFSISASSVYLPGLITLYKSANRHGTSQEKAYRFETDDYTITPITMFKEPVRITRTTALSYCFVWNKDTAEWIRLSGDGTGNDRYWTTSMLGEFIFASTSSALSVSSVKLSSNPYSGYVSPLSMTIASDSRESSWLSLTVKIFTMDGAFVKTLANNRTIDKGLQTVELGRFTDLANGRYIMEITVADGHAETKKTMVFVVMQ